MDSCLVFHLFSGLLLCFGWSKETTFSKVNFIPNVKQFLGKLRTLGLKKQKGRGSPQGLGSGEGEEGLRGRWWLQGALPDS